MRYILVLIAPLFFTISLFSQVANSDNKCPCDYPTLVFKGDEVVLSKELKESLAIASKKLKENPFCKIMFNGYSESSKRTQKLCQIRLDNIKLYFIEREGISSDRIYVNCEIGGGDKKIVDIKCD